MTDIIKGFVNWIMGFFKKSHVEVPDVLIGSPEWIQPPVGNLTQNWWPYFTQPYNNQTENTPNGILFEDNCTVQSSIETIQAILNYYLVNNLFPQNVTKFLKDYYCNENGQVKLSVRYASKMANIQEGKGANIGDVWNSYSIYGLVPDKYYPDPQMPFSWKEYMANIDQKIIDFGKNSTTFFKVVWTTLSSNGWTAPNLIGIKNGLITSPISIAGKIGNIDSKGIEQFPKGYNIYEHCRIIGSVDDKNTEIDVLDNYLDSKGLMTRRLAIDFPVPCAIIAQVLII